MPYQTTDHTAHPGRRLIARVATTVLLVAALAACSSGSGPQSSGGTIGATSSEQPSSSGDPSGQGSGSTAFTLRDSGFGQSDEYVWVTSIVHNDSSKVGQTVTVHFDLKDKAGQVVKSEDQVEAFSREGQDLVVGTQVDVPRGTKIAAVIATALVEDEGTFSSDPFPEMKVSGQKVVKSEYGSWTTHYLVTNPTADPIKDLRIGVVCYNTAGKIIGGASAFPDLIPAHGQAAIDTDVMTSGRPIGCKALPAGSF